MTTVDSAAIDKPSDPRYGHLIPHDPISQGATFDIFVKDFVRVPALWQEGSHEETIHESVFGQDLSKFQAKAIRKLIESVQGDGKRVAGLTDIERALRDGWGQLGTSAIETAAFSSPVTITKGVLHDLIFFGGSNSVKI